jgi:hypothetical protein
VNLDNYPLGNEWPTMIAASFGRALVGISEVHAVNRGLGVLVFTFRMLLSVQSEAGAQLSACQSQTGPSGASQVASVL